MLAGVMLVGSSCASDDGGGDQASPSGPYARMYAALCEVASDVRSGDTETARARFFDDAHQDLHSLADEAAQSDRPAAARLLEAKERVEAGFASMEPESGDVEELIAATRTAVGVVGDRVPEPCAQTGDRL